MSIYCKFYDNNQNFLSEVLCSESWVDIPIGAVCGLFYDNTYKITELELQFDTVNLTFNSQSIDHFLVVFPASQTSLLASDVRSNQYMSDVPSLSQSEKDYLKKLASGSVDFTSIVNALNSITSALSSLANLSNLSQLANIITAITNKDNQSNIVEELRYIFTQSQSSSTYRSLNGVNNLSIFKANYNASSIKDLDALSNSNIRRVLSNISNKLSSVNDSVSNTSSIDIQNKFLYTLSKTTRALFSNTNSIQNTSISDIVSSSFLKSISDKLQNIETKLEQNLPFTTIVENEIVETNVSQNCNYSSKIEQIPFSE